MLLDVNRAYFDVLRAQATVKVAEQTVSARQTLDDQITELARNKLRSQVDVSFADVNVSEAKLLLLRAQDSVTGALAELGRAIGSDQPANFQLTDEPLPQAPPATAASLVAQAIDNRPELASLRATRESAYKFFDAERDLSRPTVSGIATAGYIPYINTPTYVADSSRIRGRRGQRQYPHLQRPSVFGAPRSGLSTRLGIGSEAP